jgi:hypothetical protein
MTTAQWLTSIFGVLILIAGIAFSLWILRRWRNPGSLKRPSGLVVGIVVFLLAWILVVLGVLGWQVFKASQRPAGVQRLPVDMVRAA